MAISPRHSLVSLSKISWHIYADLFLDFIFLFYWHVYSHVITTLSWLLLHNENESLSVVTIPLWPHGLYSPWNSPGQNTRVGSLSLLQGIFPSQESNWVLLHCMQILYQLSHKGSPRILKWVTYPSPVDLPNPGVKLGSPALQADSLPTDLSRKPYYFIVSL